MRIQTLLNRVHPLKSFVYSTCRLELCKTGSVLLAKVRPRKNGKVLCSGCGKPRKLYDRLEKRCFEFVPLWNIPVPLEYRMRRVDCPECGVKVEKVPWAEGKSHTTKAFQLFLARWARKLSWKETAESFCTSWDTVFRSVKAVVAYGLALRYSRQDSNANLSPPQPQLISRHHDHFILASSVSADRSAPQVHST